MTTSTLERKHARDSTASPLTCCRPAPSFSPIVGADDGVEVFAFDTRARLAQFLAGLEGVDDFPIAWCADSGRGECSEDLAREVLALVADMRPTTLH